MRCDGAGAASFDKVGGVDFTDANVIGLLKSTIGMCEDEEPHQEIKQNLWRAVEMLHALHRANAALASQTPTPPRYWNYEALPCAKCGDIHDGPCAGPTSETGSIPAGARLNLDAERKHAALAEAQWWHYQTHDVELCQDSKCVLCRRMMKLETELAAIGVPEPPSSNDALAKNQSAPTVCPAGPVVEGELRLREALARRNEAKWWNERTVGASVRNTQLDARVSECEEEVRRARAALTNDPPPSEHEGGR